MRVREDLHSSFSVPLLMTGSIFSSLWELESFSAHNYDMLAKNGQKWHRFQRWKYFHNHLLSSQLFSRNFNLSCSVTVAVQWGVIQLSGTTSEQNFVNSAHGILHSAIPLFFYFESTPRLWFFFSACFHIVIFTTMMKIEIFNIYRGIKFFGINGPRAIQRQRGAARPYWVLRRMAIFIRFCSI